MEVILNFLLDVRDFVGSFLVPILPYVKITSFFISGLLLYGIVYSIYNSDWLTHRKEDWMYYLQLRKNDVIRGRALKRWRTIKKAIEEGGVSDWKRALLNADDLMDEVLKMAGYVGHSANERFEFLKPELMANAERIKAGHQVANHIRQDPSFEIQKNEAVAILREYKQVFEKWGLIG